MKNDSSNSNRIPEEEIIGIVRDYISSQCSIKNDESFSDLRFDEDLGLDKIAFNEMVDYFEEEFTSMSLGFRIDMIERKEIESISDLIEVISSRVSYKRESSNK